MKKHTRESLFVEFLWRLKLVDLGIAELQKHREDKRFSLTAFSLLIAFASLFLLWVSMFMREQDTFIFLLSSIVISLFIILLLLLSLDLIKKKNDSIFKKTEDDMLNASEYIEKLKK